MKKLLICLMLSSTALMLGCAVDEAYVAAHKTQLAKKLDVDVGSRLPRTTLEKNIRTTDGTTFNQDNQIRGIANDPAFGKSN